MTGRRTDPERPLGSADRGTRKDVLTASALGGSRGNAL